jgi:hypothetical protein
VDPGVAQIARSCAVRLDADRFVGSGFFAAPGLIVTCAHVVGAHTQMTVEWQGQRLAGRVVLRQPAEHGGGEYWDFPDLALVAIDEQVSHPVAILDLEPPRPGDVLRAFGFSRKTPQSGPQADSLLTVVVGEAGDYLRVKDDQVVDGLSGCLAVNDRTGLVVGVIKASRDMGSVQGGWIIPAAQVRSLLPEPAAALRLDGQWLRALLVPLREMFEGQQGTSQMLPYQLLDPPIPPLNRIYVRQQVAATQPVDVQQALSSGRHVVFVGPPGSGKSSLVQHICGESARWWLHPDGDPPYGAVVPARLSASALASGGPLSEVLASKTTDALGGYLDVPMSPSAFLRGPAPGVSWLILVDGLDEVLDLTQRTRLIQMLEQRIRSPDEKWRFVITTRPLGGDELAQLVEAAGGSYQLLPFDRERVAAFAQNWFAVRDPAHAAERAVRFLDQAFALPLTDVVTVPLLTTIAAMVFEVNPGKGLPSNIGQLYFQFIETLLAKRRDVSRAGLESRLESLGPAGRELSAWISENAELLLQKAAHRWFFDSHLPIIDAVQDVLSVLHPSLVYKNPLWLRALWGFLVETGLLVASGSRLEWIHLSFVEYLAARELGQQADPRKWLWLASESTTANLARFTLVGQLADRRIPLRLLRQMLRSSRGLATVGDLMASGDLLTEAEVRALFRYALWRNVRRFRMIFLLSKNELAPFVLHPVGVARLREAASTRYLPARTRIEAATALLVHPEPGEQVFGARSLLALARSRWHLPSTRAAAAVRLAGPDNLLPPGSAPPDELAMLRSEATSELIELAQRRKLWPGYGSVLESARDRIPGPAERALLRQALARKLTSDLGGQRAALRLMEIGDPHGIVWLVAAVRRSRWLALCATLVCLAWIGAVAVLTFFSAQYNSHRSPLLPLEMLASASGTLPFFWSAVRRRHRLIEALRASVENRYMPLDDHIRLQASEALRQEGWDAEKEKAGGMVAGAYQAAWRMFSDWRDELDETVDKWRPEELLRTVTSQYFHGDIAAADCGLHNLLQRVGPVRLNLIARYAYSWARDNPRGARPLLLGISQQRWIWPGQRRRINRLLEVLGGPGS